MVVEIIEGKDRACLMCNTTDFAFGPVLDSKEEALDFLNFLDRDARTYGNEELEEELWELRERKD